MTWVEVRVKVKSETVEAVSEVFSRYVHQGVAIETAPEDEGNDRVVVRGYIAKDERLWSTKRSLEEALWHLQQIDPSIPSPTFEEIEEEDWSEAWKAHMDVFRVGERTVIQPSWRPYKPQADDVVIVLDPGMAFGSGLHPTTQMCLTAVEDLVEPGMDVLDLGTGSGILSIAAAKLGADRVLAVDNDPVAVRVARKNAAQNGVDERVYVVEGSLEDVDDQYDVVLVNILARVIEGMLEEGLARSVRPDGHVILAGIVEDQEQDVASALEPNGLSVVRRMQIDDWVGLIAKPT
jgi:ribosomal protein L11 methyltransferase